MEKFKKILDEKRKAFPQINDSRWLSAIDAAQFVRVGQEFLAAIPKSALPQGVCIDEEYWIIEAPFLNEDQLAYSLSQYGMTIYGR